MENENLNSNNAGNEPVEEVTFDDILKDKTYQSEYDRRVAKALETGKANWEKEYKQRLAEEKAEAERQATLTADEKIAERIKAVEEREKTILQKELINKTKDMLLKEELPTIFAESLIYSGIEENDILNKIDEIKKVYNQQIEDSVKKRMAGASPVKGVDVSFSSKAQDIHTAF
jgi:hypothetical protein